MSPTRPVPRAIVAALVGLVVGGVAYAALSSYLAEGTARQSLATTAAAQEPVVARDSFSNRIGAGKVIIGVPALGQEALFSELRPGDVVDVFAILPGESGQSPAAGTVVRRAPVLRPGGRSGTPLLLEVSPDESLALAHLIGRGARLTYAVWPSSSTSPLGALAGAGGQTATPGSTQAAAPTAR